MMLLRWQYLLLLFCIVTARVSAQPAEYDYTQYDNRNGLSNSAVNCIFEDSDGMLWVGTWDGLNRYDGRQFTVYNYNNSRRTDAASIANNVIHHLAEDRQKHIWISTMEGISRYDKHKGVFRHYFYSPGKQSRIREQEFQAIADTGGTIYARSAVQGFGRYEATTDTFVTCHLPGISGRLSQILFDGENRLWALAISGQVNVYSVQDDGTFRLYAQAMPDNSGVTALFYVNNQVFLGSQDKLLRPDLQSPARLTTISTGFPVKAMTCYDGKYLLAHPTQGFRMVDTAFRDVPELPPGIAALQRVRISNWAACSDQLLWAATDGQGLIRINPRNSIFARLSSLSGGMDRPVRAICMVDGALWIGTKGSGIASVPAFYADARRHEPLQYITNNGELNHNAVFAFSNRHPDYVFIGTDGEGIGLYDKQTRQFIRWEDLETSALPRFGSVYSIHEDRDSSLWLGTSGYGLIHLKIERRNGKPAIRFLKQYTYSGDERGLANDIIYAITPGTKDFLWIACRYGGLSLLNRKTGRIKTLKAFTYEGSLSNNDVLSLYYDRNNRLWVGTSYGLNWLPEEEMEKEQPVFHTLNSSSGLPNNTIHAITEDDLGFIWVSTNKGLAKINPDDRSISHYQQADGLQSNEFSDGAVWKDPLGYVYFGGIYGLNYFLPQQIRENHRSPKLLLSGLHVAGKQVAGNGYTVLETEVHSTPAHFTVSRSENFFGAELGALSFLRAEKCEYAWLLEGHDNSWHYGGTLGSIQYSNLPPGSYTLLVRWSNGEGLWTSPQTAFTLQVKQYAWLTWPALLGYITLLTAGVWFLYHNRRNKYEMKQRLQVAQKLREKEEALHTEQLDFFTNIAHELQTPLTLIMGAAERLQLKDPSPPGNHRHPMLPILYQQASRLTYLVQQLMEFRKAEAGFLEPHYRVLDISELVTRVTTLFIPLSEEMAITFERNIPDGVVVHADQDKMEKIMFNLLSNAFRHSGRHEHVIVSLAWDVGSELLHFSVANSGCELQESELPDLFNKFSTGGDGTSRPFSTGIGLAFTRQLLQLLNGQIAVALSGSWITFEVEVPAAKAQANARLPKAETGQSYLYQNIMRTVDKDSLRPSSEYNKAALVQSLADNHRKVILIVDDEPDIRYLLREILKDQYIIYEAGDGVEAIGIIRNQLPDLIISDVMMPRMNGFVLCNKVKNTPSTCHIPFIMLSAKSNMEQRSEGYEVGADAYVAKPFHSDHLHIRINNLFEQQKRLHQLFSQHGQDGLPATGDQEQQQFLTTLTAVIEKHLDDPMLNATTLEEATALSKMQLYRRLKTLSNMTPSEFIRYVRLQHAAQLLRTTRLTVSEIFYRTGFNNQSYFFREFRKQYQVPPNEYRAQHMVHE